MTAPPPQAPVEGVNRRLTVVLSVGAGVAVASLYIAQPLLDQIATDLGISTASAGLVATLAQVGYALGLALLVPLGDSIRIRRASVGALAVSTVALASCAVAPGIAILGGATLVVGVTAVVAQMLVALGATMAAPAERGRIVGTIMSGLLVGILLSRALSGLLAQVAGWRVTFAVGALVTLALAALLRRELPDHAPTHGIAYPALLLSIVSLVRQEPLLRARALYGAVGMAAFSILWTSLAFLLAHAPFGYSQAVIGLFGLLGAGGALMASAAGRLADRGLVRHATIGFSVSILAGFGLLSLGGTNVWALAAGIVVLDAGVQGLHVTNQGVIYGLREGSRSRITTAYMTTYFVGGALGSASSAALMGSRGWGAVCVLGAGVASVAVCLAALGFGSPATSRPSRQPAG